MRGVFFQRLALFLGVFGAIVDARHTGFGAALMVQDRLDDVRRDLQLLVHDRAQGAAEIVKDPTLLEIEPLIESLLAFRPA